MLFLPFERIHQRGNLLAALSDQLQVALVQIMDEG
jgi:hypothetical protein